MEITEMGKKGGALILSAKGRMDVIYAPEFERVVGRSISEGETNFIVDFSEVEFISSAGLRSILVIAKKLEARGGKLSLCGAKDAVKRVFEISGFSTLIPICPSVDAALEQH